MSKIAAPLISMLKITRLFEEFALRTFRNNNNEVVEDSNNRANKMIVDSSKSKNKKFEKLISIPNIGAIGEPNFLTPNAKKAFNYYS